MKLSLQQKEQFFHELCELIRSGRSFPDSLQILSSSRNRTMREVATRMSAPGPGSSAESGFEAVPEVFSTMDREVVRGGEASGELAASMEFLRHYYETMSATRRRMIVQSLYPLFLLHFAAVAVSMPKFVGEGLPAFLVSVASVLGIFYAVLAILWLALVFVLRAARVNRDADRVLQSLPIFGNLRVAFVGSRFCMMMGMLVKASGSILSAMNRSAVASGSALFFNGAERAVVAVQGGDSLGAAVAHTRAFPEAIDRAFQIGEVSGRLDQEMQRQADRYTDLFRSRMEVVSGAATKGFMVAIMLYVAWTIVGGYLARMREIQSLIQ